MEDKVLYKVLDMINLYTSCLCNFLFLFCVVKKIRKNKAPNVGLEPTTLRLRVSCSTD